ncbi:MAG: glycosyltransferase family 39 protein [Parcubacteria group bacterium]|jgi:hypothetical protein
MLKHKYKIAAIFICLLFFFLALFSSAGFDWKHLKFSGNGIIADEIPHISSGYYYLKTHRYFINPEHPPLVKDIGGLGQLLIHPAFPDISDQETLLDSYQRPTYPFQNTVFPKALEWQNNQDHFGVMYLFHPGNNPDLIAFWARLGIILANTLLLYLVYFFLSKIWTPRSALAGLFFMAVSQFSIAHGSFVVIDFMSGLLLVLALIIFAIYLKNYADGKKNSLMFFLAALFFALALLSKFSSVVLVLAAFLGGLLFIIFHKRTVKDSLKYIFAYAALMIVAFSFVSIFYAFHVARMEDDMLAKQLHDTFPYEQLPAIGTKVLDVMVYGNVFTKGLAEYFNGVFMVMSRMIVSAQNTYFLGHVYGNEGAGIWYFPVLYLTKLSLGLHFFTLLTLTILVAGFFRGKEKILPRLRKFISNPLPCIFAIFIVAYMLVTFSSTFQIGLRHIMPVILAAAILTGRGVDVFWEKNIWKTVKLKHAFMVVSVLMFFSVICSFPYYLSYYNALAGGTDNGYLVATDSNYDWGGSDVRRLAKWMRDNNVREIYTQMFADVPLKYYLGDGQSNFNLQDAGQLPPSGSLIAVSVFEYMNNVYSDSIPPERKYTILDGHQIARVGKTIFIFQVP